MKYKFLPLTLAICSAISSQAHAKDGSELSSAEATETIEAQEHIVVIGEHMHEPTSVITNPKQPRLPLPAYDGAGYLKTIPGFSIGRKGGAGGDPSLRGLGGSRISIIDDGQHAYGTCGGRMDPPTAYVYPESYDSIRVIKGPQTVKYGPVGSAGTVLFEKNRHTISEPSTHGRATTTIGSFGRQDYLIELTGGDEQKYIDLELNNSKSDHYEDGDGNPIQSSYDRNNSKIALGWTPSDETVIEFSYGRSSGNAEYADRANKGRVIENDNYSVLLQHELSYGWITKIDAQLYSNQTNHIMDQFDQGNNSGINVRRDTQGGHFWLDLTPTSKLESTVGIDFMKSRHEGRKIDPTTDDGLDDLLKKPFSDNLAYENIGLFAEATYQLADGQIVSGLRMDKWNTELFVAQAGERSDTLVSGFSRYEYNLKQHQYYAGLGYAERIPDYWEMMKKDPETGLKAFNLAPEKTSQIDIGYMYKGDVEVSGSLYYGQVEDYILIDSSGSSTISKNIDATIWGGELSATVPVSEIFNVQSTLSYSHGHNDSEDRPLGQVSPLEGRLAVNYERGDWSASAYWRIVAEQDRVAIGQGNISGQDLAESDGFDTLSLSLGWKPSEAVRVTFGIENLLDTTYAEHISRSGSGNDIPGGEPMFQVNEPGRNVWAKLDYNF